MKDYCRETLRQAYLYLDGELLSESERTIIRLHLEECHPCFERYGLEKEVTQMIARLHGCTRCPEGLRTRIHSLFDDV
jgi:mycothiol system anti-sigma-R factor